MPNAPDTIRVPRRRLIRHIIRFLGRIVAFFVTRLRVVGSENVPTQRPLIVVANHIDDMDGFILTIALPFLAEGMVAADMRVPAAARLLLDLYGYLPVMRGTASGDATKLALSVLEQKGVIIMFPEGGIWRAAGKPVHTGVAWLSQRAQAAVLPVGLMGTRRSLINILRLRRPAIEVRIGQMMPPPLPPDSAYNKAALQTAANAMMAAVESLIPQTERQQVVSYEGLDLDFALEAVNGQGQPLPVPPLAAEQARALGKLYHDLSILETLWTGHKLPIQALLQPHTPQPAPAVDAAVEHVLTYLTDEYAQFFSYRFGAADDAAMQAGLRAIQQQARAAGAGQVILKPVSEPSPHPQPVG